MPSVDKVATNPLSSRKVQPICNWCEWLERWKVAGTYQEMLGLLHCGFDVSLEKDRHREKEFDQIDRLIFYFEIAEGWADHSYFLPTYQYQEKYQVGYDEYGNVQMKTGSELRQQLAQKAFDMLCGNFFNAEQYEDIHTESFGWVWTEHVLSARLFPVIQNFFRVKETEGDRVRLCNFSHSFLDRKSHKEKVAVAFLLKLAQFSWKWREPHLDCLRDRTEQEQKYSAIRLRLESAKPWMIEVLASLKQLNILEKWLFGFDQACLDKLRELAMGNTLTHYHQPVNEDRKVLTIEEACLVGSPAAWLLKKRELGIHEKERLIKIKHAERQKEEADEELRKLWNS